MGGVIYSAHQHPGQPQQAPCQGTHNEVRVCRWLIGTAWHKIGQHPRNYVNDIPMFSAMAQPLPCSASAQASSSPATARAWSAVKLM